VRRGLAAVAAVSLLCAGCGGGASDDPAPSSTPSPESSSTPTATPTTTGPATPTPDPAAYLPVPEGRELTPPGTVLDYDESALVAWKPRQDVVGVVGVRVLKVRRTTVAKSLAGYRLSPEEKASTPYFVSLDVGNAGGTDLGGRQLPIYVVDSDERLIAPTGVDQKFAACPGALLPAIFAPADESRSCLIFLVSSGATLRSVMFRPPEGVVPLTWVGKVKDLGATGGDRKKKPDGAARPPS
jgi:hypothetical protein